MATTISAVSNLIAGQPTQLNTPQGGGGAGSIFGVVIYNNSPFVLLVNSPQGSGFLLQSSADIYAGPGLAQGQVFVTPIIPASVPVGTFLGTAQAMWLAKAGDTSAGYPQPLIPFPGGAFTPAVLTSSPFPTSGLDIGPLFKGNVLSFATPAGTGLVQLTFLGTAGIVPPISNFVYTLTGLQSGTVYTVSPNSGAPPTAPFAPLTVNIPVNPNAGDTIYTLAQTWTGAGTYSGVKLIGLSAAQAAGVPTFATNVANATGTTASLIAAPASGALYLFEADVVIAGTTSDTGSFTFSGSTIGVGGSGGFGAPASVPFVDHVDFKSLRCPGSGGAVGFASGVGTTRTTIRYAFGP